MADREDYDAAMRRWMMLALACCAAGEVLVVAAVLASVRRGLSPLRPLAREISSIDSSRLAERISTAALPAELRPVVEQVNSLLERLAEAFLREQSFTASAAHELRTPLAGMRAQLEVMLRRPRESEQYRQGLQDCLGAIVAMHRMVEKMLTLARLDSGQTDLQREAIDLNETVERLWRDCAERADAGGRRLETNLAACPPLAADRTLLEMLLGNLLANAAEYADAGATIRLRGRREDDQAVLELSNPAADLEADDVERLFDRLWRRDAARHDVAAHNGLGLSIARRCAELLGAALTARLDGGVLTFTLRMAAEA